VWFEAAAAWDLGRGGDSKSNSHVRDGLHSKRKWTCNEVSDVQGQL
jgi:hypothetical protein